MDTTIATRYSFSPIKISLTFNIKYTEEDKEGQNLNFQLNKEEHILDHLKYFMYDNEIDLGLLDDFLNTIYDEIDTKMKLRVEEYVENVMEDIDIEMLSRKFDSLFNKKEIVEAKINFELAFKKLYYSNYSEPIFEFLVKLITEYSRGLELRNRDWSEQIEIIKFKYEEDNSDIFREISEARHSQKILQHEKDIEMIKSTWSSEIKEMQENQKLEFQEFIIQIYYHYIVYHYKLSQLEEECGSYSLLSNYTESEENFILSLMNKMEDSEPSMDNISELPIVVFKQKFEENRSTSKELRKLIDSLIHDKVDIPIKSKIKPELIRDIMDVMGTSEILARSALEMCDSDKNSAVLLLMDSYSKVEQYAKDKQLAGQKSTPNSNDNNNNNTPRNRSNNNNNNGRFNTFQQNHKANLLNLANNAKNWFKKSIENLVNDDDNDSIIDSNLRAGNNFRILEETSIIPLGSNIRTNFKFILTNFDVLNITFQSEKELFQARLRQLYEIYDKKLNAKVVFVPIDKVKQYHLGNVANTELFEKCKKSTELHFPTINEQLRVLTETYLDNLNEDENENIQEGEFFVTRHSNLFNIQLVVHIMLNLENDLLLEDINQKSALIIGFRNLISSSSKLKIHSLQIPIISPIVITNSSNNNNLSVSNNNNLSISPSSSLAQKLAASTNGNKFNKELSRSSSPSSTGTKRIEEFFKCLKNMFIEFSRTATPFIDPFGNSLDEQTLPTITFVLPNENTGKLSGSLLSFNASFNGVKNSFGIVFKANDAE